MQSVVFVEGLRLFILTGQYCILTAVKSSQLFQQDVYTNAYEQIYELGKGPFTYNFPKLLETTQR